MLGLHDQQLLHASYPQLATGSLSEVSGLYSMITSADVQLLAYHASKAFRMLCFY